MRGKMDLPKPRKLLVGSVLVLLVVLVGGMAIERPARAVGAVSVDTVPVGQMAALIQALNGAGVEIVAVVPVEFKEPNQYVCDVISEPCWQRVVTTKVAVVSSY